MQLKPMVSIIICTYNRCEQLRITLKSIETLTYENLEVLVIDNNSTDDTKLVANQFSFIRYIFEEKQGLSYARNRGLSESNGEFICFLDDDIEIINKSLIEEFGNTLKLNERIAGVGGLVIPLIRGKRPWWLIPSFLNFLGQDRGKQTVILTKDSSNIIGANMFFKRSLISGLQFNTELGRSKTNLISGEDLEFIRQIIDNELLIAYTPDASVYHLIPDDRMKFKWFMKRYFYEGVTDYIRGGRHKYYRRLHKPITAFLALAISLLGVNKSNILNRFMRFCYIMGIIYGPIFEYKNK